MMNVFSRKETILSEDAKQFIHSLPPTYVNSFRKRRQLLPIWSTNKYCVMVKSSYLVYYRMVINSSALGQEVAANCAASVERNFKFLNLANCTIKMIDDDTAGYVFCVAAENGRGGIYFAADTEKERVKFTQHVAVVQNAVPKMSDFETLKVLGKGHYGRVILAKKVKPEMKTELYAIKEMKTNQVKAKILYTERCVMEWVANHPFILNLDYALARGKSIFLISKFMAGGDLFLHMQNHGGCFDERTVRFYGAELLLAIEHMHKLHILHRDIKPENILLDMEGHIKLADMGLAKRLESQYGRTRTMCGTDTYLPPEMVNRTPEGHGLAVDLWQFGCLLFELAAGYPPFYIPQSSQKATHQRILYQTVRYPSNFGATFKSLLMGLLVKNQEDRFGYHEGISEIRKHPFFDRVDWAKVQTRQLVPPIVPGPVGDDFVNNFDPQFTQQAHKIHASDDITYLNDRDFAGFDYACPNIAYPVVTMLSAPSVSVVKAAPRYGKEQQPEFDGDADKVK